MRSVITNQIRAYEASVEEVTRERDSVMELHHEAMLWQDVGELVNFGVAVAKGTVECVTRLKSLAESNRTSDFNWDALEGACRSLLAAFEGTLQLVHFLAECNCPVDSLSEFADARLAIRESLAHIVDLKKPSEVRDAANSTITSLDYEESCRVAKANQPPQSWFDEDVSRLR